VDRFELALASAVYRALSRNHTDKLGHKLLGVQGQPLH